MVDDSDSSKSPVDLHRNPPPRFGVIIPIMGNRGRKGRDAHYGYYIVEIQSIGIKRVCTLLVIYCGDTHYWYFLYVLWRGFQVHIMGVPWVNDGRRMEVPWAIHGPPLTTQGRPMGDPWGSTLNP